MTNNGYGENLSKAVLTFDDILYMQDTVVQWNLFGGNLPTDKSLIPVYKGLTEEELLGKDELLESWEKQDWVWICDGVGDSIYTGFFWGILTGDSLKEEDRTWFENITNSVAITTLLESMRYNLQDNKHDDCYGYNCALIWLLVTLSGKINVRKVFDKVTESNYSKFPLVADVEDIDAEVEAIIKAGRYGGVFAEKFDSPQGERVVFKAMEDIREGRKFSKAKIIKSRQFKDVVGLEECIY